MHLTHPFSFPAFSFLARLFQILPRRLPIRPAAPTQPHGDAGDTAAPAGLHADLGLPPHNDAPPDAQSLRHAVIMRIG